MLAFITGAPQIDLLGFVGQLAERLGGDCKIDYRDDLYMAMPNDLLSFIHELDDNDDTVLTNKIKKVYQKHLPNTLECLLLLNVNEFLTLHIE